MADYLTPYKARPRYNPAEAEFDYENPYAGTREQAAFERAIQDTQTGKTKWREDLEEARAHNRALQGYQVPPRNPYAGYRYEDTKALVDLIGRRNVGVKFNPTLNSATTAAMWLQKQRENARTKEEQEKWARWRVEQEDRDHDKYTPDNVVVYSDYINNRVKSIDGFSLVPRNKKESLRARYDMFPDRETRSANLRGPMKKALKAYFRKFPNPETWDDHPFEKFVSTLKDSLFNITKKRIEPIFQQCGFTIYSPRKEGGENGTLLVTQYMTILQRMTSWVMSAIYSTLSHDIPQTYDWVHDPQKFKTKSRLHRIEEVLKAQATQQVAERLRKVIATAVNPSGGQNVYDYIVDTATTYLFVVDGIGGHHSFVLQFISDLNAEYTDQIRVTNITDGPGGLLNFTLVNEALEKKKAASVALSPSEMSKRQGSLLRAPTRHDVRQIRSNLGWSYPTEMGDIDRLVSPGGSSFGGSSGSGIGSLTKSEYLKQSQEKRKKTAVLKKKEKKKGGEEFILDTETRRDKRLEDQDDDEV
jgi:hypothetical protein